MLLLHAVSHLLVDALCVSTLFSCGAKGDTMTLAVVLYNTLAFSTQCLVGLVLDRVHRWKLWCIVSMSLVLAGAVIKMPVIGKMLLIGMGNSLFHVSAGTITLCEGGDRAAPLGVFVAPGALGVTLGTCFPACKPWIAAVLTGCVLCLCLLRPKEVMPEHAQRRNDDFAIFPVVLLTAAVAVRAIGGSSVSFPWKTGVGAAFLLTAAVVGGKILGGVLCDRIGPVKTALFSIPVAAVCTAFFPQTVSLSLLGQLLLNCSMPVTLWLIYRAMPDAPALAFGLAASALWPGTIAGMLFRLTGPALWCCVCGSFLFGMLAILLANNIINKRSVNAK